MGQVQVPAVLGASDDPTAALVGSITCLAAAVGYCIYSVVYPERQQRLIDAARKKRFRQYAVKVGCVSRKGGGSWQGQWSGGEEEEGPGKGAVTQQALCQYAVKVQRVFNNWGGGRRNGSAVKCWLT